MQCEEKFKFTNHLEASNLLCIANFPIYTNEFPQKYLDAAFDAYPFFEKGALKSELSVLYTRTDLIGTEQNLVTMLGNIIDNNLQTSFPNTVRLMKILLTTPMTSAEAERCFSTLKRIKTFLRATMMNERLSDLAMLSSEYKLINKTADFNEKVIQHFATSKNRRTDLIFK